ncbi:CBS domain protein [uncultured Desulfobacterium sp.]|uniref:CBS domain protein n=1 Tax=uncultured Desulfobacterium sp. TaxID=201089 RepID=A0A445MZN0_9BACT|nr:CBS domain protein [uncultured Desulfobacterium sp.]
MEDDSTHGIIAFIKSLVRKKSPVNDLDNLTEEINDLMDEGQARGLITDEESDMVHGVLDLKETRVHSIMIPRTEISSAPADSTLGEVIRLVNDCGHTRIPIFKDNIDEIIGILHAKDLLKLFSEDPASKIPPQILREPYFVPETQKVGQLLRDLKQRQTHLAIVTDEYGGTSGIITIEDILEEIVGEIMDEHDEEPALLTALDEETLLVDARLAAEKLKDYLNINLPEGDFESVGGLIIHLLGRIPGVDEKVVLDHLEFTIKKADQRKIDEIIIKSRPQTELS